SRTAWATARGTSVRGRPPRGARKGAPRNPPPPLLAIDPDPPLQQLMDFVAWQDSDLDLFRARAAELRPQRDGQPANAKWNAWVEQGGQRSNIVQLVPIDAVAAVRIAREG